jgi:hypothetical protein
MLEMDEAAIVVPTEPIMFQPVKRSTESSVDFDR